MGWTSWRCTRAEMIAEICTNSENEFGKWILLAKQCSGNHLWSVWEYTNKVENKEPERYIRIDLLQRFSKYEWGHKDMTESMGPFYYSCPLKYFDMVPEPKQYDGVSWRDKVREYWVKRNAKSNKTKRLNAAFSHSYR